MSEIEFHGPQKLAVRHDKGPMMVLAGPGSGKTTVITHRTRFLIRECGVDPGNILVITFTKASAVEMKERFEKLMGEGRSGVNFGTFHAIFFQILKYAYRFDASNIVREEQKNQFIRELMDRLRVETEDENEFISSILSEISAVKGEMLDLTYYYAKNCSEEIFKQIYEGYEARMRQRNLLDFDDMLVMCHQLFTERPDILGAWQSKYRYILVDEFQDINRVQYEIVKMLAKPEDNLFIVGDDDQSIYRFRGAKPEIMLGFEKDYEGAKRVLLNVNYRCTKPIVDASLRLIGCNKARFFKEIIAGKGEGRPVLTRSFEDPEEETKDLVREISDYTKAGYHLKDIAVLYRTNMVPRMFIERLMEYNVPFYVKDTVPNLYDHWITKNVVCYMRAAAGNLERSNILPIINRPNRYISRDAMENPLISWDEVKNFYQDKEWMEERIQRLEYDLSMIKTMAPAAAVNYIRKGVGYDSYIREYAEYRRIKPEDLIEILDQLQESAAGYKSLTAWQEHMESYTKELAEQVSKKERQEDGLTLMTMHSSKGLEYRIVYILDANEGITPHHKAVLDADLEEERRMFYVAMTRAKERLCVLSVRNRCHKKQEISRFVKEYLGKEKC